MEPNFKVRWNLISKLGITFLVGTNSKIRFAGCFTWEHLNHLISQLGSDVIYSASCSSGSKQKKKPNRFSTDLVFERCKRPTLTMPSPACLARSLTYVLKFLNYVGWSKCWRMSKGGWDDSFFSVVVVVVAFSDAVVSALEADHDLPEDQAVAHQREWQRLIIQKREKRKQCHSFRRRLHHNV